VCVGGTASVTPRCLCVGGTASVTPRCLCVGGTAAVKLHFSSLYFLLGSFGACHQH